MLKISKWIQATHEEPVFEVAGRSLEARLDGVLQYLPLAAQHAEDDVEYVHQLRVCSRRATAAVRMYRELLPWTRSGKMKKLLSRIRRSANDARDDDVLMLRLEQDQDHAGAAHLLERVREHRLVSQKPLIELFDDLDGGRKFQKRVKKLLARLRQRAAADRLPEEVFGCWARSNLRPYVVQFFHDSLADLSEYRALHQFRISAKQLRYTMELLASAFPPRFTEQLYAQVESLQDRLGEINDLATAQARYAHWIDEALEPCEAEYLEQLLVEEKERLGQCRAALFDWWTPARREELATAFECVTDTPYESLPSDPAVQATKPA